MKKRTVNISLLLALLVVIAACNAEKRAIRKDKKAVLAAKVTFAKHPEIFAEQCAVQFPVRAFDSTPAPEITFSKGGGRLVKDSTETDITGDVIAMLQADGAEKQRLIDSFKTHPYKVKGDCPPVYVPYPDTIKIKQERYRTVESQAMAIALRTQLDTAENLLAMCKQKIIDDKAINDAQAAKLKKQKWSIIIILIIIGGYVVLKISGKFKLF